MDGFLSLIFLYMILVFFDIPYLALYNQGPVLRLSLHKELRPKLNPNQAILGV
jgi:hypothetical protein